MLCISPSSIRHVYVCARYDFARDGQQTPVTCACVVPISVNACYTNTRARVANNDLCQKS